MLFALHIKNIALLDDVEIEFQKGLNVLTGETGAGKSILISSINLLLGERANRELIRHEADRAEVSGLFYVENPMQLAALSELGIEPEEDGALTLSRQLLRDGKNLCRIAGRAATLAELRQVGNLLVNIHGQHDSQALLDPTSHIHFLDSFLKADGQSALKDYQEAFRSFKGLEKKLKDLEIDEAEKLRKLDMLRYEYNEIEAAALSLEEEEELTAKKNVIQHKKQLEKNIATALAALVDGESGNASDGLSIASDSLASASSLDEFLSPLSQRVDALAEELHDLSRELRNYFEALSEDEQPLEEIEARLDVIYRLKRKYGGTAEAVLAHGETCREQLSHLENSEAEKKELEKELEIAQKQVEQLSKALSTLRLGAIPNIEEKINETLHFLNMPEADFKIMLTEAPLSRFGAEQVTFFIKTNAGGSHAPLNKIISGGELSRIMLAIQSVLTDGDAAQSLIFDEIDTGVSGATAQKIGRKLRELAKTKQVLCVTHLAQIAAMANAHFLIEKRSDGQSTATDVTLLSHNASIQELARIISGEAVTETTLKQAEELIQFGEQDD